MADDFEVDDKSELVPSTKKELLLDDAAALIAVTSRRIDFLRDELRKYGMRTDMSQATEIKYEDRSFEEIQLITEIANLAKIRANVIRDLRSPKMIIDKILFEMTVLITPQIDNGSEKETQPDHKKAKRERKERAVKQVTYTIEDSKVKLMQEWANDLTDEDEEVANFARMMIEQLSVRIELDNDLNPVERDTYLNIKNALNQEEL